MGANILLIIAASLLLVGSAAGDGKVDTQVFHVAGKVLCQDCNQGWNEWVNGAKPIKGCKVSVTCLDERSRVVQYAKLKPQNCFLRLVSSPDPVCNIATNFAGGKSGYVLGPFYYTTPMCDEPDTSSPDEDDSDDGKQGNY
ncbi:hypothetical protein Pfo_028536 [Paulownia fortunei]|nr:hypothetical protein Pfo_028536 [Paulownia fortunei]